MLVASHIKPWRDSNNQERLDKFNGLLLLANLDKAFDLGFILFTDTGLVMISSQLEEPQFLGRYEGLLLLCNMSIKDIWITSGGVVSRRVRFCTHFLRFLEMFWFMQNIFVFNWHKLQEMFISFMENIFGTFIHDFC